MHEGTTPKS